MLNTVNNFLVRPSFDLRSPSEEDGEDVDYSEVQEAVSTYLHTAFEPPRRRSAREWWENLDEFAESLETALKESEISSEEARTLIEIYVSNMVEATVQEYVSDIVGGTLEHGFLSPSQHQKSGSLLGFWTEELEE